MNRTTKADWLTRYLYSLDFWVGGTPAKGTTLESEMATQTIRYFVGAKAKFLTVYILEFEKEYNSTIDYQALITRNFDNLPIRTNFALAIWPMRKPLFAILEGNNYFEKLDSEQVVMHFAAYDESLVGKSEYIKPLNKSFTDFFHLWARENLKGFQNDIDAFFFTSSDIHMLELKRPKESINTWKPYKADIKNYLTFSEYCDQLGYLMTNIAYSESEPGAIKVFSPIEIHKGEMQYTSAITKITPTQNILNVIDQLELISEVSTR